MLPTHVTEEKLYHREVNPWPVAGSDPLRTPSGDQKPPFLLSCPAGRPLAHDPVPSLELSLHLKLVN